MIGFAGMSHLGLVTGISLAAHGAEVLGFDPDATLVERLKRGELPVHEPDLETSLETGRKRISFTSEVSELSRCEVVYVALDVKTNDRYESDLGPLRALIDQVAPRLKAGTTLVIHSQVPPGFCRALDAKLAPSGIRVFYQVEVLIFGRAVQRVLQPERYIVGCRDPREELPAPYLALLKRFDCPRLLMRYESAELAKISINLFLISTVTMTNMIAEVCEKIGADWSEIAPTLRLDKRIGPHAYLSPGLGLSGGNLERDLFSVNSIGQQSGADTSLATCLLRDSAYRRDWALRLLYSEVTSRKEKPVIGVWGIAYKANTHSVKNSPSVRLIQDLKGMSIRAYDPQVSFAADQPGYTQVKSALEACQGVDALVIMTPWDEFSRVPVSELNAALKGKTLLDPLGALASLKGELSSDVRYFTIGARG